MSKQWFCSDEASGRAGDCFPVERRDIAIIPENRRTEYLNWMRNIRDWTLFPATVVGTANSGLVLRGVRAVIVSRMIRPSVPNCGSAKFRKIRMYSIRGSAPVCGRFRHWDGRKKQQTIKDYPDQSADHRIRHSVFLGSANDHAGAAISRSQVPFRVVYLHSLVRTVSGEKMSISKGTGLDPVALNEEYGTTRCGSFGIDGSAGNRHRLVG